MAAILLALALSVVAARSLHRRIMIGRLLAVDSEHVRADAALARFVDAQSASLYEKLCSSCHGKNLTGNPAIGAPDLTDDDWLFGSGEVAQVEQVILYGIRSGNGKGWNLADMPAYASAVPYRRFAVGPLSPADIRDTVEYLRVLEGRAADTDAARRGETIFAGRGACFDCHGADGRGDVAIGAPNLVDGIWLYGDGSRESVFNSIARGHQGSCPAWMRKLAPWEARALAAYVRGAARSAKKPS